MNDVERCLVDKEAEKEKEKESESESLRHAQKIWDLEFPVSSVCCPVSGRFWCELRSSRPHIPTELAHRLTHSHQPFPLLVREDPAFQFQ